MTLTSNTIRTSQIERLEIEAARALDHVQVALCRIALSDSFEGPAWTPLNLTDWERSLLRQTTMEQAMQRCAEAINARDCTCEYGAMRCETHEA